MIIGHVICLYMRNKRIYDINQEDILCKQKETCGYYPYY